MILAIATVITLGQVGKWLGEGMKGNTGDAGNVLLSGLTGG